ncbi:hypothetical protein [Klebsiella spallanzanii]|uniref:hypothetical protein n=1 Tax=Klebsiella spallanzanii TaxID=2587528 RepID=UPI001F1DEC05|nr:hypothetical protein [Klebsiella spallanzanii]
MIERQWVRGFRLVREKEEAKFRQRFKEYCGLADCWVISSEEPERVGEKVVAEQCDLS